MLRRNVLVPKKQLSKSCPGNAISQARRLGEICSLCRGCSNARISGSVSREPVHSRGSNFICVAELTSRNLVACSLGECGEIHFALSAHEMKWCITTISWGNQWNFCIIPICQILLIGVLANWEWKVISSSTQRWAQPNTLIPPGTWMKWPCNLSCGFKPEKAGISTNI